MSTDTPAAAPTAEREIYEDRPDQDQILAVATSIGFKYDGFGGWKCELDTGELLARFRAALSAPVAAQPAASGVDALWVELTDEDRKAVFDSLDGGLDGFLKTWGWLHFAKGIEAKCREKNEVLSTALTGAAKDAK